MTARIFIDGVETASSTYTANVGDSNSWRIGAYGAPAGGFFDGLVDNVRIYDRALTPSEIQLDMASRIQPERIPPTVTAETPANSAGGVNVGTSATATFSEPMTASTVSTSTFQLKDCVQRTFHEGHVQLVDERRHVDAVERAGVRVDVHAHGQGRH